MANIKIGSKTFNGVENLKIPLADGSGYTEFAQGGVSEPLVEFTQINPVVKAYLENTTYNPSDYTVSNVGQYASQEATYNKYQPSGYSVDVENGTLQIADANNGTMIENVSDGAKTIYNIVPETGGVYVNVDTNGNVVKSGKLIPTGSLRMLHIDGIKNVRDLGGWTCDGGTVKYGKIIRGTTMNGSFTITNNGINVLRNLIKIDFELDFRDDDEWTGTESALGNSVGYSRIPYSMYSGAVVNATMQEQFVKIFRTILDCVTKGEPIYIHCESGMDRCGTVCFLLESILGLSISDIDKDYELSSFYTYPTTLKERNNQYYSGMVALFLDGGTYTTGNTHRDRVINYMLTLGISIDEINAFRSAMIDGSPEVLSATVNRYSVTNTLTNATTDNANTNIYQYQPYSANIKAESGMVIESVKVTMGGVDITGTVWSGGEKTDLNRTITKTSMNCTLSNGKNVVQDGQIYATFVIPNDGYSLEGINIKVTMGGIDVSNYYNNGAIVIPKVTGNIVIEVTAVESAPAYTNLADPTSADWKDGYRFGSSGESAQSGKTITNYIPVKNGDVVRIKGATITAGEDRIVLYKSDKAQLYLSYIGSVSTTHITTPTLADDVYTFNVTSDSVGFFRFAMSTPTNASDVIVTVNEEI